MNPFEEGDPRFALWNAMQSGAPAPAPLASPGQQSPSGGALSGFATDPYVFGTPGGMDVKPAAQPPADAHTPQIPMGALAAPPSMTPSPIAALRAGSLSSDQLPGMDSFAADGTVRQSSTPNGFTGNFGNAGGMGSYINADLPAPDAMVGGPSFTPPAAPALTPVSAGRQPPQPQPQPQLQPVAGALASQPAHSDAAELAASQRGDTATVLKMQAAQNAPAGAMAPLTIQPQAAPTGDAALFQGVEKQYGLPDGYLGKIGAIESSNGKNMSTPLSSAKGYFQFTDSTAKQYGVDVNSTASGADGAARLAVANRAALAKGLGIAPSEVTGAQLYLAHQQGAAGALKLLTNPDTPAAQLIGAKAAAANGGANLTGGQMASKWMSTYDRSVMGKGRGLPGGQAPLNQGPGSGGGSGGALSKAPLVSSAAPEKPTGLAAALGAADPEDKPAKGALAALGGGGRSKSAPLQLPQAEGSHEADLSLGALIKRRGKIVKGILGNGRYS